MQSLQARIDSFKETRRVKRYPTKSSSSAVSVKWPHPPDFQANANTLAEAGFFFNPSWDDRDTVACFLCGKELSDWDESDDPFEIHYTKCRSSCAWAVVRCGLTEDLDDEGRFVFGNKTRLPTGKAMEKARLKTFGEDWWPHDAKQGHGATSIKMARAGFVYTPQGDKDDTVTCLYCNLSLSGWEKGDDPIQEHRVRDSKTTCPFLSFSSKHARSKAVQPAIPAKELPPVDRVEEPSEDELAVVPVSDPPLAGVKRGKTRSATATVSSKSRRKTKGTRGKAPKTSAPASHHSPSLNRTVSREQDEAILPDALKDSDVPPPGVSPPRPVTVSPPPSGKSHQGNEPVSTSGSVQSSRNGAPSMQAPGTPGRPDSPPGTALNRPEPVVSLSPVGQPTITNCQLTHGERSMSLEQWIRQEINYSHERFLTDGRRQIELFKTKAAELRKCIDEL